MKEMKQRSVDVIIPVYQPDKRFSALLQMLQKQSYPIRKIIVINTERSYWNDKGYEGIPGLEVHHVTKAEFDHGGTRNLGAGLSGAEIMVFMTDDAVPKDRHLVEALVEALDGGGAGPCGSGGTKIASAYARQLPTKDCRIIERYTRAFNYPEDSRVKTAADLPELGIKTYFSSNVCCAYDRRIFMELGGFTNRTIFNEDMIYAAAVIKAGYGIAYAAEAEVIHSHNLSGKEQFHRNFDLAVSQADHPEVFEGLRSEGEGIRLVKKTASYLITCGKFWLLPVLLYGSGCKYIGYWLGKRYRKLPKKAVMRFTMNPGYWAKDKSKNDTQEERKRI